MPPNQVITLALAEHFARLAGYQLSAAVAFGSPLLLSQSGGVVEALPRPLPDDAMQIATRGNVQ